MTFENQPDALPTNKAVVAALMSVIVFHLSGMYVIPPELLGAYTILLQYAFGVLGGLLSAWGLRDRAGVPIPETK